MIAALSTGTEDPAADFSGDTIWVVVVKALLCFVAAVVLTLFAVWAERRVIGRMQQRPGPNRHGPFGLLQSLADGVKLALKEDLTPKGADRAVFVLAPVISATTCFITFAVIPFGDRVRIPFTDVTTPLQLTDMPVAVLYVLAVASVGVYGIVLAGWSSGSTYPLLGALRSTAQVISYEIAMGLALVSVFLWAGSMSTSQIVAAQQPLWFVLPLFLPFAVYCVSMVGETNRAPFDLPEAEGELVGGFHTEYSSLKFALFFLAEYVNMVTVSALATTMFLGGWRAPWPLSAVGGGMLNHGYWTLLWFFGKTLAFMFVFVWLRASLPRLRYDQFMDLGWKRLIPVTLAWTLLVAVVRYLQRFTDAFTGSGRSVLIAGGLALAVLALLYDAWGRHQDRKELGRRKRAEQAAEAPGRRGRRIDPFAGGYPVPPLPGQTVSVARHGAPQTVSSSALPASDTGASGTVPPEEVHRG